MNIQAACISLLMLLAGNLAVPYWLYGSRGSLLVSSGDLVVKGPRFSQEWLIRGTQDTSMTIDLLFMNLGDINRPGCFNITNTLLITSTLLSGEEKQAVYCGRITSVQQFSSPSNRVSVKLSGDSDDLISRGQLFELVYQSSSVVQPSISTLPSTGMAASTEDPKCGPCGGVLYKASDTIHSPNYPNPYLAGCDCKWLVSVTGGHIVKFTFWKFDLEPPSDGYCPDFLEVRDGSQMAAKSIGKYCGSNKPLVIKTSDSAGILHFVSDGSGQYPGFEILYSAEKKEEELTGLKSVAAILGAVSFGIFICLLLCSVMYKRITEHRNSQSCPDEPPEDDYEDVVQQAAPPSYQTVMATPDMFPVTPDQTPMSSPHGSPHSIRRSAVVTPSPLAQDSPYLDSDTSHSPESQHIPEIAAGIDIELGELPSYPDAVHRQSPDICSLPPPPSYEIASSDGESSSHSPFRVPRNRQHHVIRLNLVGQNGMPPTYEAVTSGSEAFGSSASDNDNPLPSSPTKRNRGQLRSRSERSSSSNLFRDRARRATAADSDDENDEAAMHEIAEEAPPHVDSQQCTSSPECVGGITPRSKRRAKRRRTGSPLSHDAVDAVWSSRNSVDYHSGLDTRQRSTTTRSLNSLARHAIHNSASPLNRRDIATASDNDVFTDPAEDNLSDASASFQPTKLNVLDDLHRTNEDAEASRGERSRVNADKGSSLSLNDASTTGTEMLPIQPSFSLSRLSDYVESAGGNADHAQTDRGENVC